MMAIQPVTTRIMFPIDERTRFGDVLTGKNTAGKTTIVWEHGRREYD